MNTDAPDDTEVEEEYEPEPCILGDGDVLIEDPVELFEMTHSIAMQVRDGGLYVLDRATRKWRNVEVAVKSSAVRSITAHSKL
jgi:hypothetical protein